MALFDAFDSITEEIIKPADMAKKIEGFPETAVATFDNKIIAQAATSEGARRIGLLGGTQPRQIYELSRGGKRIAVWQTFIGGAASAGLLELMIAKGAKKFVFFGTCGSLDKDATAKKFIIPSEAYRDEGTSRHYMDASNDYVKVETADRLAEIMREMNVPHIKARVWTTDAIFRETRGNMRKRRDEGCVAVEMECASVMAAGRFRGAQVYMFLFAHDSLDGPAWDRGENPVTDRTKEAYLNLALDIAAKI